jgi:hypothetical protein
MDVHRRLRHLRDWYCAFACELQRDVGRERAVLALHSNSAAAEAGSGHSRDLSSSSRRISPTVDTDTRRADTVTRTPRAELLEKQIQALRLVRAGNSYDAVAKALGYANRGSAWRLVQNALQSKVDVAVEDHRALELARLDALQFAHWHQACNGDAGSAHIVLRVIEQRSRLLGLDSKKSLTHLGPVSILRPS